MFGIANKKYMKRPGSNTYLGQQPCVAGTNVNNHKSKIRNIMVGILCSKNIQLCSYSDYGCTNKTIIILIIIIMAIDDVAKLLNSSDSESS